MMTDIPKWAPYAGLAVLGAGALWLYGDRIAEWGRSFGQELPPMEGGSESGVGTVNTAKVTSTNPNPYLDTRVMREGKAVAKEAGSKFYTKVKGLANNM